jgi:hypothetical protein
MADPEPLTVGELMVVLTMVIRHAPDHCRDRIAAKLRALLDQAPAPASDPPDSSHHPLASR